MVRGLLDTSVLIDWHDPVVVDVLPEEAAISSITMAELAAGPHLAADDAERARRQSRLQEVEAMFEPLVFDVATARSYGLVVSAAAAAGGQPRRRFADLLIAATAHAHALELYTRNADDFRGLHDLVRVVPV